MHDNNHKDMLREKFPTEAFSKKIIVLDIEDLYPYMDMGLVKILKIALIDYL